jgi:hypothetical protein
MPITSLPQAQGGVGGLTQQQHMMLLQQQQQSLAHQMLQQQHHAQAVAQQQLARSKEALMSVSAERRYFEQVCTSSPLFAVIQSAVSLAVATVSCFRSYRCYYGVQLCVRICAAAFCCQ